MWRFEQKGLFAREKVPKGGICKPGARPAGRKEARPLKFAFGNRIHWLSWEASANRRSLPGRFQAARSLKFALENRFHWLSREASANRRSLPGRFRAARPLKFALENRIHWLSEEASANRESHPGRFRAARSLKFALENRIHWLSREASANREAPEAGFGRSRPAGRKAAGPSKNKKTLNQRTEASADSKFFHYILHPIYKEETYSFSPKAKRRMVRPTPSSSLLSAT